MRILIINKYHYYFGGSETYVFGLAQLLSQAGHEVIFLAMRDERNFQCKQEKYFVSNVDFNGKLSAIQKIRAGFRMVYSFESKREMEQIIKNEKPDIIHINLFHRVFSVSILDVAKRLNVPVVFTIHDLNCICPNHTMIDHGKICEVCLKGNYIQCARHVCFKESRFKCLMAAIESYYNRLSGAYDKIDLFIAPSEFFKAKFEEAGITHSRILCMRNFLTKDVGVPSAAGYCGDYLYFGRLSEEKGLITLVEAFHKLGGTARLNIAGIGPLEAQLKALVMERNLQDSVHFLGFLKGDALKQTVGNAKCIILPSEWYENGPYAIMEAMAAGKPVIVNDIGGLPEIVDHGKTGYLAKPFDTDDLVAQIRKMDGLTDQEYARMGKMASQMAQEMFSAEKYLKALDGHYKELLARHRR